MQRGQADGARRHRSCGGAHFADYAFGGGQRQRRPRESTHIAEAMEYFLSVNKRRTVCFVVSDLEEDDDLEAAAASLATGGAIDITGAEALAESAPVAPSKMQSAA